MSAPDEPRGSVWRWPLPLGFVWLAIPVVGIVLRIAFDPVPPHDYWWHLAAGRYIDATGNLPAQNLFLYTLPVEAPFVDQPWLGQWILYRSFELGGHAGPYLLRAVVTAATWLGVVWSAGRRCEDPRVVGGFGLVAVVVSAGVFSVRTRIFAFPLFVAIVGILFEVADGRVDKRALYLIPPLTALWANLHGSFVLAPILVALVAACVAFGDGFDETEATPSVWAGTAVATLLASCANPHGFDVYRYAWEIALTSDVASTVTEWQAPELLSAYGAFVSVALIASVAVMFARRRQIPVYEWVVLLFGTALAATAVRSVFWWAAVALLVVPRHLAGLLVAEGSWRSHTKPLQGAIHLVVVGVLAASCLLVQPGMPGFAGRTRLLADHVRQTGPGRALLSSRHPIEAVERLAEMELEGRVFHDQAVGGLLDFRLGLADSERPRRVAFVDARMGLIPAEVWKDYFAISAAAHGWREKLEKWNVDALLLHPDEQRALIDAVREDAGWELEMTDGQHLLLIRDLH